MLGYRKFVFAISLLLVFITNTLSDCNLSPTFGCIPLTQAQYDAQCQADTNNNRAFCSTALLDTKNCTVGFTCGQTCPRDSSFEDEDVCDGKELLWAIVAGAVLGGVFLIWAFSQCFCHGCVKTCGLGTLPTQGSAWVWTHLIWAVWWLGLLAVSQAAFRKSGCMQILSYVSLGVGVVTILISSLALCCSNCFKPFGRKTPLMISFPYDHAFRLTYVVASLSVMGIIYATQEFVGHSIVLSLIFAGVLGFHFTFLIAPEWGACTRLGHNGPTHVLPDVGKPKLFHHAMNSFVYFHICLLFSVVLDVIVRVLVDWINTERYNTAIEDAEADAYSGCPDIQLETFTISSSLFYCPMLFTLTLPLTNEIREYIEGKVAWYLAREGSIETVSFPEEILGGDREGGKARFMRPTLSGVEANMPMQVFYGFGSFFGGIFFMYTGIRGLAEDTSDYIEVEINVVYIVYGLLFIWHFYSIVQLLRSILKPNSERIEEDQQLREILLEANRGAMLDAPSTFLYWWTRLRIYVQTWSWQQAYAAFVFLVSFGAAFAAMSALQKESGIASSIAYAFSIVLVIVSALGAALACLTVLTQLTGCNASCNFCTCWVTFAMDETRRISTLFRAAMFQCNSFLALILSIHCNCSHDQDNAEECSDEIKIAKRVAQLAWSLTFFLFLETIINDNLLPFYNRQLSGIPWSRALVVLSFVSNVFVLVVNVSIVASASSFKNNNDSFSPFGNIGGSVSSSNPCADVLDVMEIIVIVCVGYIMFQASYLNNEMSLFLRYSSLKIRSPQAREHFHGTGVQSSLSSAGGIMALLPYQLTFTLLTSTALTVASGYGIQIPVAYMVVLWMYTCVLILLQISFTPGYMHPIISSELLKEPSFDKAGSLHRKSTKRDKQSPFDSEPIAIVENPMFSRKHSTT
eukprot:m.45231 g.45231  ORF g.45231 m.45231 type:complete len:915 (-) comp10218_c1_seq1:1809-4553(-)